jgi:hypothetical protein
MICGFYLQTFWIIFYLLVSLYSNLFEPNIYAVMLLIRSSILTASKGILSKLDKNVFNFSSGIVKAFFELTGKIIIVKMTIWFI